MRPVLQQLVLESAHRANILPITSVCNVRCVFCSHRQNPPGVEIYQLPPRTLEEVGETLDFIDPDKKIVIGESVTRISEGEPFTHPEIGRLLTLIRERFPATSVQLTTNGTLLDRAAVELLARLAPIEINLSLNSSCAGSRARLMHDRQGERAVNAARLLREYRVPYHGSIVAMPHLTGWADLEETILYLAGQEACTVRIFLPGYTDLASAELRVPPGLWPELAAFIGKMRTKTEVPLIIEPQKITNLQAVVTGVIAGSPVSRAGIRAGDIITKVCAETVYSRVDAFARARRGGGAMPLELRRGGEAFFTTVEKQAGETSGLVMEYDVHPELPAEISRTINSTRRSAVLLMTSGLAEGIMHSIRPDIATGAEIELLTVPSRFFGGNIMCAGLLTVADFTAAWEERFISAGAASGTVGVTPPGAILLPASAFDSRGRDLTGRSFKELAEITGAEVVIC